MLGSAQAKDEHPEIQGVWAVTLTYEYGSCPDETGSTKAFVWTVSRNPDGVYAVQVQGGSGPANLTGKDDEGTLRLVGIQERGFVGLTTSLDLKGSASKVTGRAVETRIVTSGEPAIEFLGAKLRKDLACAVIWTVEAHRQGK
jgi:hypothetical protein